MAWVMALRARGAASAICVFTFEMLTLKHKFGCQVWQGLVLEFRYRPEWVLLRTSKNQEEREEIVRTYCALLVRRASASVSHFFYLLFVVIFRMNKRI